MRFQPVVAKSQSHLHGHIQIDGSFHKFRHLLFHQVFFGSVHIKHQFVVHLQDHPGLYLFFFHPVVDVDHGYLDHVSRAALYRRIDGVALGKASAARAEGERQAGNARTLASLLSANARAADAAGIY